MIIDSKSSFQHSSKSWMLSLTIRWFYIKLTRQRILKRSQNEYNSNITGAIISQNYTHYWPELQKDNKHSSMIIKLNTNSAGNIDGHIIHVNISSIYFMKQTVTDGCSRCIWRAVRHQRLHLSPECFVELNLPRKETSALTGTGSAAQRLPAGFEPPPCWLCSPGVGSQLIILRGHMTHIFSEPNQACRIPSGCSSRLCVDSEM